MTRVLGSTTGAVGGVMMVWRVVLTIGTGGAGATGATGASGAIGNELAGQLHAQLQAPFSILPVPCVIPAENALVHLLCPGEFIFHT